MPAVSLAQAGAPRTQDELLKKIDSIGATPKKQPLGFEGTPVEQAMAETPQKRAKGETMITAGEVTFDQMKRVAVFIKDVDVQHPEFTVLCDRLTAYLKKEANVAPADPPPAAADPNAGPKSEGGGIDHVIAEANPGKMVKVTQKKLEADGSFSVNIGYARKVTYDEKTGDIVLSGNPSIQNGVNRQVAVEESAVMTLNRNGNMRTDQGRSRTIITDSTGLDNGR